MYVVDIGAALGVGNCNRLGSVTACVVDIQICAGAKRVGVSVVYVVAAGGQ